MTDQISKCSLQQNVHVSAGVPKHAYTCASILEHEHDSIFFRSWNYVAHVSELPEPGSYVTATLIDQSVFLIRGKDSKIRGFFNVCQHRAHQLLKGVGKASTIQCPYHAWVYDLSGQLLRATHAGREFACNNIALKPIRVEEMCGFLFVNLDENAAPLSEVAPGFNEEIKRYVPDLASLRKVGSWMEERQANWKLVIENDVECYHCYPAHPYLSARLNMKAYRSTAHGNYTVSKIENDAEKKGVEGNQQNSFLFWYLWPNTEARVMPGPTNLAIYTNEPVGPNRMRKHYHHFVGADESESDLEQIRHNPADDPTVAEDVAIVESVQRNLVSRGFTASTFVVDNDSIWTEHLVHHFQLLVSDALAIPTAPGDISTGLLVPGETSPRRITGRWLSDAELLVLTPSPLAIGTDVRVAVNRFGAHAWKPAVVSRLDVTERVSMTIRLT